MLNGQSILVIEEEFLVALDIQRILESAEAGQLVFARSVAEAHDFSARWPEFSMAIISMGAQQDGAIALAQALSAQQTALVLTTTVPPQTGLPGLDGAAMVAKPFAEDELLTACASALERR